MVKYLYPFIVQVLNEDVAAARERLKRLGIGAVVSGDGVWLTRGHFSQCGSFTVGDLEFLDALLAYAHAAKRGPSEPLPTEGEVVFRDANSRGPGGPTRPLGTPSRTPWILSI